MKNNSNISLIIPCYNEIANIQKGVLDKIGNFTRNNPRFNEVLIVDDGSSDQTKNIIKQKYLKQFPKFRLIENPHSGKAYTVITGLKEAKEDYVMFSDIDLATPIEESGKLVKEADLGYDVIIGSRTSNRDGAPVLRRVMAIGFIMIRNTIIGLRGIRDTQCGFKLFRKSATQEILKRLVVFEKKRTVSGSSVSAGFDLEFLYLARKLHYKIREVPVVWRHVETKNVNFLTDSIEGLKDILLIKYYEFKKSYKV